MALLPYASNPQSAAAPKDQYDREQCTKCGYLAYSSGFEEHGRPRQCPECHARQPKLPSSTSSNPDIHLVDTSNIGALPKPVTAWRKNRISVHHDEYLDRYKTFDLVEEINECVDDYRAKGEELRWITLYDVPGYVKTVINSIRAKSSIHPYPSINTILMVCVSRGLSFFHSDDIILDLIGAKTDFYKSCDTAYGDDSEGVVEIISDFIDRFPLKIPGTMSKSKKVTMGVPIRLHDRICGRSEALGISMQDIVMLCVVLVLGDQVNHVSGEYRKLARATWLSFMQRVKVIRRAICGMIEELSEPIDIDMEVDVEIEAGYGQEE